MVQFQKKNNIKNNSDNIDKFNKYHFGKEIERRQKIINEENDKSKKETTDQFKDLENQLKTLSNDEFNKEFVTWKNNDNSDIVQKYFDENNRRENITTANMLINQPSLTTIQIRTNEEIKADEENQKKIDEQIKRDEKIAQKLTKTTPKKAAIIVDENQGPAIQKETPNILIRPPTTDKPKEEAIVDDTPIPAITETLKPNEDFNDPPVEDIQKLSKEVLSNTAFNDKTNVYNFTVGPYANYCQNTQGMRLPTENVQHNLQELVFQYNNLPGQKLTTNDLIQFKKGLPQFEKYKKDVVKIIQYLIQIKQDKITQAAKTTKK
jgi:hypothetical protein